MPTDDATDHEAAVVEVEDQMSVLAGRIRESVRDAALCVDPQLRPFGFRLLRLILRGGPIHASAAADQLYVERSVISRQARQLEQLGLLELQPDPNDGRARFLALTPIAVERLNAVAPVGQTLMHQALDAWETDDLRRFAAYIARLNA